MIEIKDKKNCVGCTACAEICPKKCIQMKPDEEGFLYSYKITPLGRQYLTLIEA